MSEGGKKYYDFTADQLADLFQPDNVRNGDSLAKLGAWGGIAGIQKALQTDIKGTLISNLDWNAQRFIKLR